MINIFIHAIVLLVLPPLLPGIINKVKAVFAGRTGAPITQPYFDLIKLARKGLVQSTTTTWVFRAGPVITVSAVALAGFLVPLGGDAAPVSFTGDMVLFAYFFALARFFTTSAALDTGSAFEGMGAAREVTFTVLSEPALFFAFLVLARLSGSLSLTHMLQGTNGYFPIGAAPSVVLIVVGLFVVLLAENCRIPVDDPNTHLELTMIHEAMVLDHSGPLLGIIQYASSMKLFILGSVLINVAVPLHTDLAPINWLIFIVEIMALAVVIGVLESLLSRIKMRRVPHLLVAAFLLCGSSFILLLR